MRPVLVAALALLLGSLLAVLLLSPRGDGGGVPPSRPAPPPEAPSPGVREDSFLGVILPPEAVEVAAPFDGLLEAVTVQMGETVAQGAELARLDVRALRAQEDMARALHAGALAQENATAVVLEAARERLARYQQLSPGNISEEELSQARFDERAAAARHQAARALTQERQAALAQVRDRLEEARLRAPFAGTVALRYLDAGGLVRTGTPLLRLLRAGPPRVRFAVPEARRHAVTAGAAVRLLLPDSGLSLSGTVEAVSPEVDVSSRMVFALAAVDPSAPASTSLAGLVARVSLEDARSRAGPASSSSPEARRGPE